MNFAFPANHWVKIKESKKKNKYLNLAKELKKLWSMKVTVMPMLVGMSAIVLKGIGKETGRNRNQKKN